MAVYNKSGNILSQVYDKSGNALIQAYDKSGNPIMDSHAVSNAYTRSLIFKITDTSISNGTQGIACDSLSQKIAQLYTGKILMFDQNGTYTQVASVFNLVFVPFHQVFVLGFPYGGDSHFFHNRFCSVFSKIGIKLCLGNQGGDIP